MIVFQQILFLLVVAVAGYLFIKRVLQIRKNILLGQNEDRSDQPSKRWRSMLLIAFGQKKMFKKPIPALLHLLIYVGFLVINLEVIEFILDGMLGKHRTIAGILQEMDLSIFYTISLNIFEFLSVAVILSCVFFLIRRNIYKVKSAYVNPFIMRPPMWRPLECMDTSACHYFYLYRETTCLMKPLFLGTKSGHIRQNWLYSILCVLAVGLDFKVF